LTSSLVSFGPDRVDDNLLDDLSLKVDTDLIEVEIHKSESELSNPLVDFFLKRNMIVIGYAILLHHRSSELSSLLRKAHVK